MASKRRIYVRVKLIPINSVSKIYTQYYRNIVFQKTLVLRVDWGFQIKILNVLVSKKTFVTKLMILFQIN